MPTTTIPPFPALPSSAAPDALEKYEREAAAYYSAACSALEQAEAPADDALRVALFSALHHATAHHEGLAAFWRGEAARGAAQ